MSELPLPPSKVKQIKMVSIITVNYNSLEVTTALLDSIRHCGHKNIEVIVVDNASEVSPKEFIVRNYPEVRFVQCERNLGFAGGNNAGIKISNGDFLFFLNNDAELTRGTIEVLLAHFEEHPNTGVVSPMICYYNAKPGREADIIQYAGTTSVHPLTARNRTIGEREADAGQYVASRRTAYAHGAAMMVPRQVIEKVGCMPEEFFLYYEELDWCEQIRRAGYEIWVVPKAKVYHKESYTVSKVSTIKTYYLNRNRILFMRRNSQSWQWCFFCLFLFMITVPKNSLLFIFRNEWPQLKAFWRAVLWNFFSKEIKPASTPLTFLLETGR